MKQFKVRHVVLCEVQAWSTITAENFAMALEEAAKITSPTDSGNGYHYDHEIVSDKRIVSIEIERVEK